MDVSAQSGGKDERLDKIIVNGDHFAREPLAEEKVLGGGTHKKTTTLDAVID